MGGAGVPSTGRFFTAFHKSRVDFWGIYGRSEKNYKKIENPLDNRALFRYNM